MRPIKNEQIHSEDVLLLVFMSLIILLLGVISVVYIIVIAVKSQESKILLYALFVPLSILLIFLYHD